MRIKTLKEIRATGLYEEYNDRFTHIGNRTWLKRSILGRPITHINAHQWIVDGMGEWHLREDSIVREEETVLKILAKVDALQIL